jgi:hypothetical protein
MVRVWQDDEQTDTCHDWMKRLRISGLGLWHVSVLPIHLRRRCTLTTALPSAKEHLYGAEVAKFSPTQAQNHSRAGILSSGICCMHYPQAVPVSICRDVIVDNIPQVLRDDDERIHQVEWEAHIAVEARKRKGRPALQCVACAARPALGTIKLETGEPHESSVY